MEVVFGLDLIALALVYGYCLAAQPGYATPGARRVADWTHRQPLITRCAIAFVVWVTFMTGIYYFAQGTV